MKRLIIGTVAVILILGCLVWAVTALAKGPKKEEELEAAIKEVKVEETVKPAKNAEPKAKTNKSESKVKEPKTETKEVKTEKVVEPVNNSKVKVKAKVKEFKKPVDVSGNDVEVVELPRLLVDSFTVINTPHNILQTVKFLKTKYTYHKDIPSVGELTFTDETTGDSLVATYSKGAIRGMSLVIGPHKLIDDNGEILKQLNANIIKDRANIYTIEGEDEEYSIFIENDENGNKVFTWLLDD